MTVLQSEYFNTGPNAAAIVVADVSFDSVSGTPTYTDVSPIEGAFGALSTAGNTYFRWQGLTLTDMYLGFAVRFNTLPGANMYIGDCRTGTTRTANFRVEPAGVVVARSNFTAIDTGNPMPAGTITAGDLVFFDWHVNWAAATQELRVYVNGTLSWTITGACNPTGSGITDTGVLESGSSANIVYDSFERGDTWLYTPAGDILAPGIPTNLSLESISTDTANISWTASSDDTDPSPFYRVYVDAVEHANSPTPDGVTTFPVTGLSPNTNYAISLAAEDDAGNLSSQNTPRTILVPNAAAISGGIALVTPSEA